jgi:hypothetical protein
LPSAKEARDTMSEHTPEEISAAESLLAEVLAGDIAKAQVLVATVPTAPEIQAADAYHEHGRRGSDSGERV